MNTPLFSIVVPIYNTERYIQECIDSILSQTFTGFELILVDDGSTDSCPEICDIYEHKDSRISVMHKENGGHSSSRMAGLLRGKGEYIIFLDSDDYIDKNMLQKIKDTIVSENKPDIICYAYSMFKDGTDDRIFVPVVSDAQMMENHSRFLTNVVYNRFLPFFSFGQPPVWCKAIRKDLLNQEFACLDTSIRVGEDLAITLPCLLKSNNYYLINESLYNYRITPCSMSRKYDANALEDLKSLLRYLHGRIRFDQYDISNQMAVYTLWRLKNILYYMCLNMTCKELKKYLKLHYTEELGRFVSNAHIQSIGLKDRVIVSLIKRQKWRVLFLLCKAKG